MDIISNSPFVSIVIPVRNEESIIKTCLKSLEEIDYPLDKLEVVIVNDGSTDNTKDIVLSYNWKLNFKYIETEGVGISKAKNIGFRGADGDYIAFTDADCVVPRDWIKNLIDPFKDEKIASVGGPNITPEDDTEFAKCMVVLSFPCDWRGRG